MIQINITDDQLPLLAKLIAQSPGLARLVASQLRDKPDTYSVPEAAKALGVHVRTIKRRVQAQTIPRIPNLKNVRIPAAFIDRLLNPLGDA